MDCVGSSTHYSVIIIGAGQAGLSVSWHLTQTGIPHTVFDRAGPLNGKQTCCDVASGLFQSLKHQFYRKAAVALARFD